MRLRAGAWKALLALLLVGPGFDAIANDPNSITDPSYPYQWPLDNVGQPFPESCGEPGEPTCRTGTPDADIDWPETYASGVTGSGVIVALGSPCPPDGVGGCTSFDPTVYCQHPDLAGQLWVNPGESGGGKETNGVDDDSNGFVDDVNGANFASGDGFVCMTSAPSPPSDHDTEVARVMLGAVNGTGAVGVAPGAKLMLITGWFDTQNNGFYENGGALEYAEQHGARVVVVPYTGSGGPITSASQCASEADPPGPGLKRDEILLASNVLVLWGFPHQYPGCDPSAIGLMFSNHGDGPIVNPTFPTGSMATIFNDFTAPGDRGYIRNLALSWALPVAGGVAALALENNPGLSRAQLQQRMEDGADKVGTIPYDGNGWNNTYGYGRLNAFGTVSLGDVDLDSVDSDGDFSGVAGDAICASGSSTNCDDSCPLDPDPSQIDSDADLHGNVCDNCATIANPSQADGGGILGPVPDGVGDPCQCGDATGDGVVDAADVTAAQLCVLASGACLPTCDANASASCEAGDPLAVESALATAGSLGCILP